MCLIADPISIKGASSPPFCERSFSSSSSVGGISGVLETDHSTEPIEQTAPTKKDP